jgi:predicted ATP-grasp superfamily ATP-dependent carboligase
VLEARDQFPGVQIPFPEAETFRAVCDKEAVLETARRTGIQVPAQWTVARAGGWTRAEIERLPYPVVVKPARSVSEDPAGRVKLGVSHAADAVALTDVLNSMPPSAFPVLLQQRVIGSGIGIFLLIWDGKVLASFAHRRLREKPPSGGVSVYRESVATDPQLLRQSVELLRRFDWRGVAMVEYKSRLPAPLGGRGASREGATRSGIPDWRTQPLVVG